MTDARPIEQKKPLTRVQARRVLENFRRYTALVLIVSASFGIYLLVTDKSLWLLAVSHAYGLLGIVSLDLILSLVILVSNSNKLFVPAAGWAVLTILLQIGDIATAPQYKMTPLYFAHYLFGLWAYDGLLIAQAIIVYVGLASRQYERMVAKKKVMTFFDMGLKNSRRDFLQIGGTIAALFLVAGVLGALDVLTSPRGSASSTQPIQGESNLPTGAVANVSQLQAGSPLYFDYPSSGSNLASPAVANINQLQYGGNPNILMKRSDGTIFAMSMLCTHVCCQCEYASQYNEILCPCHGSVFDQNGKVLRGPAPIPLPTVELNIDSSGNIFPVKMNSHSACV